MSQLAMRLWLIPNLMSMERKIASTMKCKPNVSFVSWISVIDFINPFQTLRGQSQNLIIRPNDSIRIMGDLWRVIVFLP